jgi:hypothetical protein
MEATKTMNKHCGALALACAVITGCPSPTPNTPSCVDDGDCDNAICVGGTCAAIAEGEGEGEGEEGEGEEGEGEGEEGEGEEGEGEGEVPLDLTPRIVTQHVILGAPVARGDTFSSAGRVAVVSSTPLVGRTFTVQSTH